MWFMMYLLVHLYYLCIKYVIFDFIVGNWERWWKLLLLNFNKDGSSFPRDNILSKIVGRLNSKL